MERLIQERVWRGSDTSVLKRALGIAVEVGEEQTGETTRTSNELLRG
jgi:hypothetical protein